MKLIITLVLLFSLSRVSALPKKVEVWFLSVPSSSYIDSSHNKSAIKLITARPCQKMGDYCFDPQIGLYKPDKDGNLQDDSQVSSFDETKYDFIAPHKGVERSMIECDENPGFFDIFCGKAKKKNTKKANLEVWIDVSSTMKQVDFQGFERSCLRATFLSEVKKSCPLNDKMKVYSFEEYRSEVGNIERVCLSGGLNDMKRIVSDIKKSSAESLIVITDIFEAEEKFIFDIENLGVSTIRGLESPMYAKDMLKEIKRVKGLCQ